MLQLSPKVRSGTIGNFTLFFFCIFFSYLPSYWSEGQRKRILKNSYPARHHYFLMWFRTLTLPRSCIWKLEQEDGRRVTPTYWHNFPHMAAQFLWFFASWNASLPPGSFFRHRCFPIFGYMFSMFETLSSQRRNVLPCIHDYWHLAFSHH